MEGGVEGRDGRQDKKRKVTMDGEIHIPPDAMAYLRSMSPFFGGCDHQIIWAPTAFLVMCIATVTSYVEWQQLDDGNPKQEYQARVAAMVRALTASPFDYMHAQRLGMTESLRDMEDELNAGEDREDRAALTTGEASRIVGVSFAKTSNAGEMLSLGILCAFYVVKRRNDKFKHIALCPRHFEIGHDANVYDGEALVVRGRDSPYGCAIKRIQLIHGLAATASVDLATIERIDIEDARKRITYNDTSDVLGIMRVQKTRLQNMMHNVRDPLLITLVEFLDAVALELASV